MLTITLFNLVGGELEGAYQGSELADTSIVSGAAKAYLGPSIGRFVPYAGLGAGVYRESLPGRTTRGRTASSSSGRSSSSRSGWCVRAEYQWIDHAHRRAPAARPAGTSSRSASSF